MYYSRDSFGSLNLTETSPVQSFTEPLTYNEVAAFLNLPVRSPVDSAEVAMIEGFISGAREIAEILQGRDLVEKQYDLSLDYWPCHAIQLRTPLQSVDLVRRRDSDGEYTTLAEDTDYIVDLARGLIIPPYNQTWPSFTQWPSSAILTRFTSGISANSVFWNDAGARLKIGMKVLISDWFNDRLPTDTKANELPGYIRTLLSFGAVPRVI